jgi:hypothetical protein
MNLEETISELSNIFPRPVFATTTLVCPGFTIELSTGTEGGECNPGATADSIITSQACSDGPNSATATCAGCGKVRGKGRR